MATDAVLGKAAPGSLLWNEGSYDHSPLSSCSLRPRLVWPFAAGVASALFIVGAWWPQTRERELSMPGHWEEEEKVCSEAQKAQRLQMWKGETAPLPSPGQSQP